MEIGMIKISMQHACMKLRRRWQRKPQTDMLGGHMYRQEAINISVSLMCVRVSLYRTTTIYISLEIII